MKHPDVAEEQQALGVLLDRLEELKSESRAALDRALRNGGGTPQARSERESFVRLYTNELSAYNGANAGLYFGRLDTEDGELLRIGRVGLRADDEDMTTLLLDWRADLARPFYLATTARPEGVHRRRHLRTIGRAVIGLHDEYLTYPEGGQPDGDSSDVVGESALLSALDAARTGHMSDIVETIQREQDEIIRTPHRGVLVVNGGPGTGKTAVALHRAAYLLYTHRQQLDRSGVLIVGPNPTFLEYISRVLPSLGESGVVLRTLADLYPGVRATGPETLRGEDVKGSEAMIDILRSAVRARQLAPAEDTVVTVDGIALTVSPAMVRRARGRARMSRRPHNRARQLFVDHLLDALTDQYADLLTRPITDAEAEAWAPGSGGVGDLGDPAQPLLTGEDHDELRAELAGTEQVNATIDEWWPVLTPSRVLAELLGDPNRIAEAAQDYVEEDQAALLRADGAAFSTADVPLLDELAELLGTDPHEEEQEDDRAWREQLRQAEEALEILTGSADQEYEEEEDIDVEILAAYDIVDAEALARRHKASSDLSVADRAAADRTWAYGHVIVDEAQELSPMAWRMIMRRSPNRWMTIVGDHAQTSSPAGVDDWHDTLSPYVEDRWELRELTVNYRTPASVSAVATRLLEEYAPDVPAPRPVREGTAKPEWLEPPVGHEVEAVERFVESAEAGRAVTVLVSDDHPADQKAVLDDALAAVRPGLTSLTVSGAKGLEFDYVLVLDPERILDRSPQGLQDLYVAVSRATQHLALVQPGGFRGTLSEIRDDVRARVREHEEHSA